LTFQDIIILFSTGLAAGFLSGFLGIGGGVVAVPVLVYFLSGTVEGCDLFLTASTISLGVVFIASANASVRHIISKNFYRNAIIPIVLGSILGPIPGNYICGMICDRNRMFFFALVLSLLAIRIFFLDNEDEHGNAKQFARFNYPVMFLAGLFMGTISAMTGIGGGSILVPLLAGVLHFNIKKSVGIASIVMVFNAIASLAGRYYIGAFDKIPFSMFLSVFLIISLGTIFTARLGASANIKSRYGSFKKIAGIVYLLVAIQMYIKAY
jgi:uncharacterized protein